MYHYEEYLICNHCLKVFYYTRNHYAFTFNSMCVKDFVFLLPIMTLDDVRLLFYFRARKRRC